MALLEMDVPFNLDYMNSHEYGHGGDRSSDDQLSNTDDSDGEMDMGGGLEEVLWPPKMLLQIEMYGKRLRGGHW